ncbi:diguanylate cyclase [Roseiflexus sp. AH-315-K22]|nr:diguanylate cyclase [Roseiflexus sp. AH-315-K22]
MNNGPEHSDDQSPIVLVIDDSKDVHRLLAARMRKEDYSFVSAYSGEEGLRLVAEVKPSIILLDLNMPEMDGFEVLRKIKEMPDLRDRPVIVISGRSSAQDKVVAFDLGAADYVTKPFDLMELRVRVRAALRVQNLLEMLSERAHVDGLTGLWNRSHFSSRWLEAVSAARRHDRPLSVAMFDADLFKSINDTLGHPAGDAVLQGIAKTLQRECRLTDIPCRYGGEEFTLIMPDTAPDDALLVCDRIRQAIFNIVWPRHPERYVTISVGVAGSVCGIDMEPDAWIEAADKAMYESKAKGRNRSTLTTLDASEPGAAPEAGLSQAS